MSIVFYTPKPYSNHKDPYVILLLRDLSCPTKTSQYESVSLFESQVA